MASAIGPITAWFLQHHLPIWFDIDTEVPRGGRPQDGKISIREAAKKIGVSYPQLQKLFRLQKGVGPDFEQKVADLRFGGDVTALRKAAEHWAATKPPPRVFRPRPYGLERTVEIGFELDRSRDEIQEAMRWVKAEAKLSGPVSDEAIRAWYAEKRR